MKRKIYDTLLAWKQQEKGRVALLSTMYTIKISERKVA